MLDLKTPDNAEKCDEDLDFIDTSGIAESASEEWYDGNSTEPFIAYNSFDGLNKRADNRYEIGLDIIKAMIDCGKDPETVLTYGRSALMFSVLAKDFSYVKHLVELGVDVNKKNEMGETALSLATETPGREEIAKYLRSKGAVE